MLPSRSKYNPSRMYLKDKPHKWGTKLFSLVVQALRIVYGKCSRTHALKHHAKLSVYVLALRSTVAKKPTSDQTRLTTRLDQAPSCEILPTCCPTIDLTITSWSWIVSTRPYHLLSNFLLRKSTLSALFKRDDLGSQPSSKIPERNGQKTSPTGIMQSPELAQYRASWPVVGGTRDLSTYWRRAQASKRGQQVSC
jgi:hypothetical protein